MKVVIIGYGSIGKKHTTVIKRNFNFADLYVLSKRKIKIQGVKVLKKLEDIIKVKPNYVIVASETIKHYEHLKFLENNFKNIKILIEKPLFHKYRRIDIKKNKVFVGYNLRFNPAIIFLKEFLKKNYPIDIKFITNSFLPNWRKRNYKLNYSADKIRGGGVILDLSHEIDLALWLFGDINIKLSKFAKDSNLKINSEDNLKLFGKIKNSNFFLDLSYYSKNEVRTIFLDTIKKSILIDLKNNFIKIDNKIKKITTSKFHNENTYLDLHKAMIFNKKSKLLCTLSQGMKVLKLIERIKKR